MWFIELWAEQITQQITYASLGHTFWRVFVYHCNGRRWVEVCQNNSLAHESHVRGTATQTKAVSSCESLSSAIVRASPCTCSGALMHAVSVFGASLPIKSSTHLSSKVCVSSPWQPRHFQPEQHDVRACLFGQCRVLWEDRTRSKDLTTNASPRAGFKACFSF